MSDGIAQTPLQMLRLGRGDGYRAALDAGKAMVGDVVACVLDDPRWDRQVESRDGYYASLLLHLDADVQPLVDQVSSLDRDTDESTCWLPIGVLAGDCEAESRELACAAVALTDLAAVRRLRALADDAFEAPDVRRAAASRVLR